MYLVSEALSMGYGGITKVSKASGVSRVTITQGIREFREDNFLPLGTTRKKGGGRYLRPIWKYPLVNMHLKAENILISSGCVE